MIVLLLTALLSISQMSESEQKETGIDRLSVEEKQQLDLWLVKSMPKPPPPPVVQKNKIAHGEFAITGTKDLGRFITLDNGITYDIPSRSRKKTMSWKVGEKVRIVEPVRPTNYKLDNIDRDQEIGGKIAK